MMSENEQDEPVVDEETRGEYLSESQAEAAPVDKEAARGENTLDDKIALFASAIQEKAGRNKEATGNEGLSLMPFLATIAVIFADGRLTVDDEPFITPKVEDLYDRYVATYDWPVVSGAFEVGLKARGRKLISEAVLLAIAYFTPADA